MSLSYQTIICQTKLKCPNIINEIPSLQLLILLNGWSDRIISTFKWMPALFETEAARCYLPISVGDVIIVAGIVLL